MTFIIEYHNLIEMPDDYIGPSTIDISTIENLEIKTKVYDVDVPIWDNSNIAQFADNQQSYK